MQQCSAPPPRFYLVKSGSVRRRAFAWRHRRLPDARLNGPGGARRRRALRASCMANRDTRCESRYTQPIETFAYEYHCCSFSGPHIMHSWRRRALRLSRSGGGQQRAVAAVASQFGWLVDMTADADAAPAAEAEAAVVVAALNEARLCCFIICCSFLLLSSLLLLQVLEPLSLL